MAGLFLFYIVGPLVKFAHQSSTGLRYSHPILLFILCIGATMAQGQELSQTDSVDTTGVQVDTAAIPQVNTVFTAVDTAVADTVKRKKLFEPNPKKSGMYSSILPGLGQAYNRQYWKIPVVYAILGTAGYFIGYNYNKYTEYRQAYIYAIDGDPNTNDELSKFYDAPSLQRLQNNYKQDLDIIVLLTSVGYALQIMDAVASAHLKNFDISKDISMQMKPMVQNNFVGLGLVMNFK